MIEASTVHRRRTPIILGSPENNDCVGAMQFLLMRVVNYGVGQKQKNSGESSERDDDPEKPDMTAKPRRLNYPCAKNSEMSCDEIAPSRKIVQRASSSVRSTMVEAISRGEAPPSTMMGMRTPS